MMQKKYMTKEEELLQNESRRKIYNLVKMFAGCSFRELERKSNAPTGTLQYHLHYLTKHNLLSQKKDGNKVRYFAASITPRDEVLLSLLRQKHIRHILLFLLERKECRQRDIIALLQLSPATASWYLSRLTKQNMLKVSKKDGEHCYRLALPEKEIVTLLIEFKESFFDRMVDRTVEMWSFK